MMRVDEAVLLWLNQWVGFLPWVDSALKVLISDYFMPVLFSIILLALWFTGVSRKLRELNQRAVWIAAASMGLVNAWVTVMNAHIFRFRPFVDHDLTLLFYRPTDSSFPANPTALAFAAASGAWLGNKKVGGLLFALGTLYSAGRVYAGVFYPSDVIAGGLLGIASTAFMTMIFRLGEPIPTIALRIMRTIRLA